MENVSSLALKRIANELNNLVNNPIPGCFFYQKSEWNKWKVTIKLSISTPFHGSPIELEIVFPPDYPYSSTQMYIQQAGKIFHPNIRYDGYVCSKIVNESNKPQMMVRERLEAFITLMEIPNPYNPFNSEAAKLYESNPREYYRTAYKKFRGY